jgi:hypothetical protein
MRQDVVPRFVNLLTTNDGRSAGLNAIFRLYSGGQLREKLLGVLKMMKLLGVVFFVLFYSVATSSAAVLDWSTVGWPGPGDDHFQQTCLRAKAQHPGRRRDLVHGGLCRTRFRRNTLRTG